MNKVIIGGKEYTMKDAGVLRVKMLGSKYIAESGVDKMIEWIGDEQKEKKASESFRKFLNAVLVEPYDGMDFLDLKESEVFEITSLFFRSAAAPATQS